MAGHLYLFRPVDYIEIHGVWYNMGALCGTGTSICIISDPQVR